MGKVRHLLLEGFLRRSRAEWFMWLRRRERDEPAGTNNSWSLGRALQGRLFRESGASFSVAICAPGLGAFLDSCGEELEPVGFRLAVRTARRSGGWIDRDLRASSLEASDLGLVGCECLTRQNRSLVAAS